MIYQVAPIFLLFLHFAVSLDLEGNCRKRCDEQRQNGQKEAFKFECTSAYSSDHEINLCQDSCESCPKEVCDETINSNDWTCPSWDSWEVEGPCKYLCLHNRPKGKRSNYTLNCEEAYSSESQQRNCKNTCQRCPSFVCDASNTNIFHCPNEPFVGECKAQCDMARDISVVGSFNFECDEKYEDDDNAKQLCQQVCREQCPSWACDKTNENSYHCPAADATDAFACRHVCDEHRPLGKTSAYEFNCKKYANEHDVVHWQSFCENICSGCDATANKNGQTTIACHKNNPKIFYCPRLDPPNPSLVARPSYKGICKDRCEASRGGGFHGYELNCMKMFKTKEEMLTCRQDCKECPETICERSSNYTIINCRSADKDLQNEETIIRHQQERQIQETEDLEVKCKEQLDSKENINCYYWIGSVIIAIFVLIGLVGGVIYTVRKYRQINHTVHAEAVARQSSTMISSERRKTRSKSFSLDLTPEQIKSLSRRQSQQVSATTI